MLHSRVQVPDGDVLVFAGDFMNSGYKFGDIFDFGAWFSSLPHKKKVIVPGNHDRLIESSPSSAIPFFPECLWLINQSAVLDGIFFYGSPITPYFMGWAYGEVPEQIKPYWDKIPERTDVLITHGPPEGILDGEGYHHMGCPELLKAVERVKPQLHLFGHIHSGYGHAHSLPGPLGKTHFYNVAVCNQKYRIANPVTVIDI